MTSIRRLVLSTATIIFSTFITTVNGECCVCGRGQDGTCVGFDADDSHVYMEGSNSDGQKWTCGGESTFSLNPGPCGIAQTNAFASGGCRCKEDNRPVSKTDSCDACQSRSSVIDVKDQNGKSKFFLFPVAALTCYQMFDYSADGFVNEALCGTIKKEMIDKGCCPSGGGGSGSSYTAPPPPPPYTPPPPPPSTKTCQFDRDCPYGLNCDKRVTNKPFICSDYLKMAKRARTKRICRKGRGGRRNGCD